MFKFLKEKLSKTISRFSKKIDEESEHIEESIEQEDKTIETLEEQEKSSEQKIDEDKKEEKEEQIIEESDEKNKDDKEKDIAKESTQKRTDQIEPKEKEILEDEKKREIISNTLEEEDEKIPEEETVPEEAIKTDDVSDEYEKRNIEEEEKDSPKEQTEELKEIETGSELEEDIEVPETEKKEEIISKEEPVIEEKKKKGFFSKIKERITKTVISEKKFDDLFWDIEMVLLENNVAVEVIEKIRDDLKKTIVDNPIPRGNLESHIIESLKSSINDVLEVKSLNIFEMAKKKKPLVICFMGINGSGKTTTIAKLSNMIKKKGLEPVLAASDTFRAAAIQQLSYHAEKTGVKIIKHDYGSDAAAVAFDAVSHAKSKGKDFVLIDTAGRMHSNSNLMEEMKKVVRVSNPDLKIFVGESITGNDCVDQAKRFDEAIGIDAIILTKADIDEKGGASLSISYVTKKPIIFLGIGQEYDDLKEFSKEDMIKNLGI